MKSLDARRLGIAVPLDPGVQHLQLRARQSERRGRRFVRPAAVHVALALLLVAMHAGRAHQLPPPSFVSRITRVASPGQGFAVKPISRSSSMPALLSRLSIDWSSLIPFP